MWVCLWPQPRQGATCIRTEKVDEMKKNREDQIRELAVMNISSDAYLILQEAKRLKTSLAMELQVARGCRVAQEKEFREFVDELWGTLREIQAQFRIDATLLHLIKPNKTGEKKWQENEGEGHSNHSRLLNGFAKSGN